jgi:hypothetical protein
MAIHLSRNQIGILHAFKDMSNDFVVDDSGDLYAIFEGAPLKLAGISDEYIESHFD